MCIIDQLKNVLWSATIENKWNKEACLVFFIAYFLLLVYYSMLYRIHLIVNVSQFSFSFNVK